MGYEYRCRRCGVEWSGENAPDCDGDGQPCLPDRGEMGHTKNQTAEDAFTRVVEARTGSLANRPTAGYLIALRQHLYEWTREVETAMHDLAELEKGGV